MTHTELLDLVELYALDALEAAEAAEFEHHVEECGFCKGQLAAALTVSAALVSDAEPPNHVWDRIVAEIEPGATVTPIARRSRRFSVAITAVAAAVGLVVGALALSQFTPNPERALLAEAEVVAADPGSISADFVVDDVTVARVILGVDGDGFVLPTSALPRLDEARTYQLWVINEQGAVISGGVLGNAPEASTFTWTDGVAGFALTREIAGGVAVSDGDVVAVVSDL